MSFSSPKGVFDILPAADIRSREEYWRASEIWNYVEGVIRQTAGLYGFSEIRTPVFEHTELFCRSAGETSDIVTKEMYTFQDKGDRSLTLRPEGTAPVMRSFVTENLDQTAPIHKYYYLASMFRYERPQAGRYRQHHQFGVEAIGSSLPDLDVEAIDLLYSIYAKLGINRTKVYLNSIGTVETRARYREGLLNYLHPHLNRLSADSRRRFETNPLRILDSKDAADIEIVREAPSILQFLDSESRDHFEDVQRLMHRMKIPFELKPTLVRGLDYYNKTVFEVVSTALGAQDSIGGGGRYDGLLKTVGGPDLPAFGFGSGMERIIQTLLKEHPEVSAIQGPLLYFIPLGDSAREVCSSIVHGLRHHNIKADMDLTNRKLKKVMSYASDIQARYVAVVGDSEIANGYVELKNMESGIQFKISVADLLTAFTDPAQESRKLAVDKLMNHLGEKWFTENHEGSPLSKLKEAFKNKKVHIIENESKEEHS